jgi:hypothetical protein
MAEVEMGFRETREQRQQSKTQPEAMNGDILKA